MAAGLSSWDCLAEEEEQNLNSHSGVYGGWGPELNAMATDYHGTNPIAASPDFDVSTGLIPVEDGLLSATPLSNYIQFESRLDEDERRLQENLLRLLQPPLFNNFAHPARGALQRSSSPISVLTIPPSQHIQYRWPTPPGARRAEGVEDRVQSQGAIDNSNNSYEFVNPQTPPDSDAFFRPSQVTTLPLPGQQPNGQGYGHISQRLTEAFARNPMLSPVQCTFGHMTVREKLIHFESGEYDALDVSQFRVQFEHLASKSTGLLLLVIENWQPWFLPVLESVMVGFPAETVLHLNETREMTMLPVINVEKREISCIMEHINAGTENSERSRRGFNVGSTKAHCLPIAVWTSANGIRIDSDRPIVVLASGSTGTIGSKVSSHYSGERWHRLESNQTWIYLDLHFLFTRWDRVWGVIKQNLSARIEEVHGRHESGSIVEQMRRLHADNNVMINLREHLRIHRASLRVVMQRAKSWRASGNQRETQVLHTRLDDAFQLLEYYDLTATSLLEQQQNLLSLAFNLETAIQGQAVARLNALAFVFLPLSLVATIFGITTFDASPKWYPVAAIPVLIATVTIAYAANKFFASKRSPPSTRQDRKFNEIERSPILAKKLREDVSITTRFKSHSYKALFSSLFGSLRAKSEENPQLKGPLGKWKPVGNVNRQSLGGPESAVPMSSVHYVPGVTMYSPISPSDDHLVSHGSERVMVPSSAADLFAQNVSGHGAYTSVQARTPYWANTGETHDMLRPIPE